MVAESTVEKRICQVIWAGCVDYHTAWEWQRRLVARCAAGEGNDTLLLLEHPPTITLGRRANPSHVLLAPDELARRGVTLVATDRGGDVTYHAPGQLVGYPILKPREYGMGMLGYLRNLEEALIRTLATYDIEAKREPGLTGVWVGEEKIAAIGVRQSASGVTSHGFALNISPDLRGFEQIIPCGIADRRVTSLQQLLGEAPPFDGVVARLLANFATIFNIMPHLAERTKL